MSALVAETKQLLANHEAPLIQLSQELQATGKLDAVQVAAAVCAHGLTLTVQPEGHLHIRPYDADLKA